MGKISVIARGARRKNSRLAAACQLFAWSEMTLYRRGNWYYLDAAEPEELFSGLQKDLVRFSLAAYLAELTEFVAGEETEAGELLRLLLNGLYALGNLGRDPALVKPAFTFRLLALAGFEPLCDGCAVCGAETARDPVLDAVQGVVHCRECGEGGGEKLPLSAACVTALEHILHGPSRRLYSFTMGPEDLELLENLSNTITETALCGLGQSACKPVQSTLKYFRSEYLAHVVDHHCPICNREKPHPTIDALKCKGCGKCRKNCPMEAITGAAKQVHVIDPEKCINCGACVTNCPFGAIAASK